jgi:hypothetical protein
MEHKDPEMRLTTLNLPRLVSFMLLMAVLSSADMVVAAVLVQRGRQHPTHKMCRVYAMHAYLRHVVHRRNVRPLSRAEVDDCGSDEG